LIHHFLHKQIELRGFFGRQLLLTATTTFLLLLLAGGGHGCDKVGSEQQYCDKSNKQSRINDFCGADEKN